MRSWGPVGLPPEPGALDMVQRPFPVVPHAYVRCQPPRVHHAGAVLEHVPEGHRILAVCAEVGPVHGDGIIECQPALLCQQTDQQRWISSAM